MFSGLRSWVCCFAVALVMVPSCAVGPDYVRPPAPWAEDWIDAQRPELSGECSNLSDWWTLFEDPDLVALVETAFAQNLTLQSAARRIAKHLREVGFTVRYNQPYSGMAGMMYAVDRHGSHHRLPCLEIEVNHALFDDPHRAANLARAVAEVLRDLTDAR